MEYTADGLPIYQDLHTEMILAGLLDCHIRDGATPLQAQQYIMEALDTVLHDPDWPIAGYSA